MIKIYCEKCNGFGWTNKYGLECGHCDGKGYTEHEGNIDDLECASIERKLMESSKLYWLIESHSKIENSAFLLRLNDYMTNEVFGGKTKLEALKKAEKWIDEREVK